MIESRQFPNRPESVTAARRLVSRLLASAPQSIVDAVELMVSELAANAIRHAQSGFTLTVERGPQQVHVEVTDAGSGTPTMRSPAPTQPTGRGLRIVETFSDSWGIRPSTTGPGKTVWFELALHHLDGQPADDVRISRLVLGQGHGAASAPGPRITQRTPTDGSRNPRCRSAHYEGRPRHVEPARMRIRAFRPCASARAIETRPARR